MHLICIIAFRKNTLNIDFIRLSLQSLVIQRCKKYITRSGNPSRQEPFIQSNEGAES